MTKIELIRMLQASEAPDDAEVMIQEIACENVRGINTVTYGWYVNDGYDAPEVIDGDEDPEDYGLREDEEKVLVLE